MTHEPIYRECHWNRQRVVFVKWRWKPYHGRLNFSQFKVEKWCWKCPNSPRAECPDFGGTGHRFIADQTKRHEICANFLPNLVQLISIDASRYYLSFQTSFETIHSGTLEKSSKNLVFIRWRKWKFSHFRFETVRWDLKNPTLILLGAWIIALQLENTHTKFH